MFVALDMGDRPPKGIFGGLLNILTLPKVDLELRQAGGTRFIAARTYAGKRGVNWQELCALCGRYLDRMLLPEELEPPEGLGISPPALPRFERRLLLDTACEIITRSKMPMYRRVLGLIDLSGEYAGQLQAMLKYFTSAAVFTHNLERYGEESERLMEELGAPVLVSDRPGCLSECVLVLCPRSYHGEWEPGWKLPCPVLCGGALLSGAGCDCISGLRVSPPDPIAQACPPGIDPHLFTGALYEYGNTKDLPTTADNMLYNHKAAKLDEVVQMVLYHAGYSGTFAE